MPSSEQLLERIGQLESELAALRKIRDDTEAALAAAHVGLYVRELTTSGTWVSRGLQEMMQGSPDSTFEEALARVHPDDQAMARAIVSQARRDKADFRTDLRMVGPDGQTAHREVTGHLVCDAAGTPVRLAAVVVDVTERRKLEAQVRQAHKMEAIGQLAGGVAHEFNNQLTVILGYSRFLLPALTDDAQRQDVSEIIAAGERAADLAKQLLAFSRHQPQNLTTFNLNTLVRKAIPELEKVVGERVTLRVEIDTQPAPIRADRTQIQQVLTSLILNGRDAMPGGGEIRIGTKVVPDGASEWVHLIVTDNGTGMDETTKARLFEPFFTTRDFAKGGGLGLATVFGIAVQSDGYVDVRSSPGSGATFTVVLPRAAGEFVAEEEEEDQGTEPRRGHESVLLVEDEAAVRSFAAKALTAAGYHVIPAATPEAAVKAAEQTPVDLLLTDVQMPGATGPDLYRHLAESRPGLRVLYVSGYMGEDVLDTRHLGARAAFLGKPFTVDSLLQKVREVLGR